MKVLDANTWGYIQPKPLSPTERQKNNDSMERSAKRHAHTMRLNPSPLEKMMMEFLKCHHVGYDFQKIFYIKDKKGCIKQYYIADFYIPNKKLIIEVDGKFHKEQEEYDTVRTNEILKHNKKTKLIRFEYKDFRVPKKLVSLLERLK